MVEINVPEKSLTFRFKKQAINNMSLGKTKTKHCKIPCRFELDTGPVTARNDVESNSTKD